LNTSSADRTLLLAPALVDTRHEYDHLFAIYVPIAIGVFALIVVTIVFAVLRYRGRSPDQAARWHEHNPVEGGYAVLLGLVAAFLLYLTFTAEHRVDTVANRERPSLTIDVTGAKWEWQFYYPAYGFSVRSGTVGRQPLVVPTNEAIRFNLTSADVIHAFWVPELRFKRDLTPGSTQTVTLDFDHPGVFGGQCAEFCGLRHADMVFTVHAVSPSQFGTWAASGGKAAAP
jgi:cytochrome c oxidase subunit II